MIRLFSLTCLIAAGVLTLPARDAGANMILEVTNGGAGGTVANTIDNSNPTVPTDYFVATFTKIAPIDFSVTLDSPGNFYLSFTSPPGSVVNDTGQTITALQFQLLNAPAGTFQLGAQQQANTPLPNLAQSQSNYTAVISGPPDLTTGETTAFGVGYSIPGGTSERTFVVELTPFVSAVPEPSTAVMTGLGLLGLAGCRPIRRRVG